MRKAGGSRRRRRTEAPILLELSQEEASLLLAALSILGWESGLFRELPHQHQVGVLHGIHDRLKAKLSSGRRSVHTGNQILSPKGVTSPEKNL